MAKSTKAKPFSLTLDIGGAITKSEGTTALEALTSLKKPIKIMNKAVLTVKGSTDSRTLLLQPVKAKRLFYSGAGVQQIIAKQLFFGLK